MNLRQRYDYLTWRLEQAVEWMEASKDYKDPTLPKTPIDCARWLRHMLEVINDPTLCHDLMKGMYLCTLKKGHKEYHCDTSGFTWPKLKSRKERR